MVAPKEGATDFIDNVIDKVDIVFIDPRQASKLGKVRFKTMFPSKLADYVVLGDGDDINRFCFKGFSEMKTDKREDFMKQEEGQDNKQWDLYGKMTIDLAKEFKNESGDTNKKIGFLIKVKSNEDIEQINSLSEKGFDFVIIDVDDWKIIPLENIIAKLEKSSMEIYAIANSVDEVKTLFTVLELGVDGVIVSTGREEDITKARDLVKRHYFDIVPAKIIEIREVGIGE
ncbi:MAG: 3-dehydroquinate synthase II, partial [Thermoproteota archaeon]|nr:3-dehydroquinate synthase II [Thermoproteota archaeon]